MQAQAITTEAVFAHHLQALMSGNMDDILSDYTEDSVAFSPQGVFRGLEQLRGFFTFAMSILTPDTMQNFRVIRQDIDGDYAYIFWTAAPAVIAGGDTFVIRDGKIVMQSFAGYIPS